LEASMDRDEALFVNLVMIFKSAAMQQMGKVVNPLTGKVERNLEQARFSIDTIAMLKDKTKGNLTSDLERLLESVLLELRMNFVEETKVGDTRPEAGETEPARKAEAPAAEEAEPEHAGEAGGEGDGASREEAGPEAAPEDTQAKKKPG
jgi:hypothetical protein